VGESPGSVKIRKRQAPSDKLKVSVDLNDKNNYMPVAMHPAEVVNKAREFRGQTTDLVEESMASVQSSER
jgi:hypothetical protein